MIFPHPLLMARIGEAVADSRNEDLIRSQEQQVMEWERYARELEQRLDDLHGRYRELGTQAQAVIEYTKAVEQERNELIGKHDSLEQENGRLREVIDDLRKMRDRFRDEADGIRGEIARCRSGRSKLEYGYSAMKTILTRMSDNAERIFTAEVTEEQRKKLARLLAQLP